MNKSFLRLIANVFSETQWVLFAAFTGSVIETPEGLIENTDLSKRGYYEYK